MLRYKSLLCIAIGLVLYSFSTEKTAHAVVGEQESAIESDQSKLSGKNHRVVQNKTQKAAQKNAQTPLYSRVRISSDR